MLTWLHVVPFFINEPVYMLFFFIVRSAHTYTSLNALVDSSFNATLFQEPSQHVIYFLSVIDRSKPPSYFGLPQVSDESVALASGERTWLTPGRNRSTPMTARRAASHTSSILRPSTSSHRRGGAIFFPLGPEMVTAQGLMYSAATSTTDAYPVQYARGMLLLVSLSRVVQAVSVCRCSVIC